MPKMKTHSGAAKRVRTTGGGKLLVRAHHLNNKRMKKRREKLQALGRMHEVHPSQRRRLRRLLAR